MTACQLKTGFATAQEHALARCWRRFQCAQRKAPTLADARPSLVKQLGAKLSKLRTKLPKVRSHHHGACRRPVPPGLDNSERHWLCERAGWAGHASLTPMRILSGAGTTCQSLLHHQSLPCGQAAAARLRR